MLFAIILGIFLIDVCKSQDISCYECVSSLYSSSNIRPGCQNDEPCCKDPFDPHYPSSPPLIKRCRTGVCLKTTYFWDYKYRNNTFYERLCYDKAYISRLIAPGINRHNKVPTMYELTKAEEAERTLRRMDCALSVQETPSGKLHARICPCNTDLCNSAFSITISRHILFLTASIPIAFIYKYMLRLVLC